MNSNRLQDLVDGAHQAHRIMTTNTVQRGSLLTQGQIETAGKAWVRASVTTELAYALIGGLKRVGRTLWWFTVAGFIVFGTLWGVIHAERIVKAIDRWDLAVNPETHVPQAPLKGKR